MVTPPLPTNLTYHQVSTRTFIFFICALSVVLVGLVFSTLVLIDVVISRSGSLSSVTARDICTSCGSQQCPDVLKTYIDTHTLMRGYLTACFSTTF